MISWQQPGPPYGWPEPPLPWPSPTQPQRRHSWWFLAAVALLVVGVAVTIPVVAGRHGDGGYRVGDCVLVAPAISGELRAAGTGCDTDASFVVAKLAGPAGNCTPDGSDGYDHFSPPAADPVTGSLCLVPNLAVGHCYRMGVTVGVWNVGDCADPGPASINMVKVTDRLDGTADAQACPVGTYLPARTYAWPPRTYCLTQAAQAA